MRNSSHSAGDELQEELEDLRKAENMQTAVRIVKGGKAKDADQRDAIDVALSWQSDKLVASILVERGADKALCVQNFKRVQGFMGDTETVKHELLICGAVLEIARERPDMADEMFLQLVKQLTDNPHVKSRVRGWQFFTMLACCHSPLSPQWREYVLKFTQVHSTAMDSAVRNLARYSHYLLSVAIKTGRPARSEPPQMTLADVRTLQIEGLRAHAIQFGGSLDQLMELQRAADSELSLDVPQIQETLCAQIRAQGGFATKRIFRVAADDDEVQRHRAALTKGEYDMQGLDDPNTAAALLLRWLRQLQVPVVPPAVYHQCCACADNVVECARVIDEVLSPVHRAVARHLFSFLRDLALHDTVTQMNVDNLAILFAPVLMRPPNKSSQLSVIDVLQNKVREKLFLANAIRGANASSGR
jgi:hypothetical protein